MQLKYKKIDAFTSGNNRVFNSVRIMHHNNCILFGGGATLKIEGVYNVND